MLFWEWKIDVFWPKIDPGPTPHLKVEVPRGKKRDFEDLTRDQGPTTATFTKRGRPEKAKIRTGIGTRKAQTENVTTKNRSRERTLPDKVIRQSNQGAMERFSELYFG